MRRAGVSQRWFERLFGFPEDDGGIHEKLQCTDHTLTSTVNGQSYGIGTFSLPSLSELRKQGQRAPCKSSRTPVLLGMACSLTFQATRHACSLCYAYSGRTACGQAQRALDCTLRRSCEKGTQRRSAARLCMPKAAY